MGRPEHPRRLGGLDTLRGACVALMCAFHLIYDLVFYCDFPRAWISSPWVIACQIGASWGFILLSGVSSRLSRSNVRRALPVLAGGVLVSVVTWYWGDFVRFGILQFLGCAMILYGLTGPLWRRIPDAVAPVLYLALFIVAIRVLPVVADVPHLYALGVITPDFRSADYYPLLPWFFWFLLGTWLGGHLQRAPDWFAEREVRPLAFLGRRAFAVYFIHQPLLLGVSYAIALFTGHRLPF